MKTALIPRAHLDALRTIGDPAFRDLETEPLGDLRAYFECVGTQGIVETYVNDNGAWATRAKTQVVTDAQEWVDRVDHDFDQSAAIVHDACELFATFGDEISAALLLGALPETYATAWGAPILVVHGDLVWQLPRRIRQTAQFLATVMSNEKNISPPDPFAVEGDSSFIRSCGALRLFHGRLRRLLALHGPVDQQRTDDVAINQEDLLGTLLSFTVTTFRVLEAFGIRWTDDQKDTYLAYWDLIGATLGVGTDRAGAANTSPEGPRQPAPRPPNGWTSFRPPTVAAATEMLAQLHDRQWIAVQRCLDAPHPFPWSDLTAGRTLIDALLCSLADAMPAPKRAWPGIVVRELAPIEVRSRLGIERLGTRGYAVNELATRLSAARRSREFGLRLMANDVTRHAMYAFLRADGPPFTVPGLDLTELTPTQSTALARSYGLTYEERAR
jgi:hypothetical protein